MEPNTLIYFLLIAGIIYFFIVHTVAALAASKGINYWETFFLSLLASPIAGLLFIVVHLMPGKEETQEIINPENQPA